MTPEPGELDRLRAGRLGQLRLGRPALEQPQHRRRAQVFTRQLQGSGVGGLQVRAQPVEQPTLIASGALVIAADRAQLTTDLPVRDQRLQRGVPVQGQQAADPGVLGVVLLPRRTPPARDYVWVDRNHRESRIDQSLDQQPMPGLQHDPDLGRIRFQPQRTLDQSAYSSRSVVDTKLVNHPLFLRPQGDVMKIFRPVDANSQHESPFRRNQDARRTGKTLRRADEPVLAGPHPPRRQAFARARQGRRLITVLTGQTYEALPAGLHRAKGR
jgi:hypothetical protein